MSVTTSLSTAHQAILLAAMDRIIPEDEYPSASQNGVAEYFARQLVGDLRDYLPTLAAGLESIDCDARIMFGAGFAELDSAQQDGLLIGIEAGTLVAEWPMDSALFFRRLVELIAEGYYADPENNFGNPNKASWTMIGFVERLGGTCDPAMKPPRPPMLGEQEKGGL